jgi:hypothetical protein
MVGRSNAPNQEQAIRMAIRQFAITNPEHQKRLVAQRTATANHCANPAAVRRLLGMMYVPTGGRTVGSVLRHRG